MDNSSFYIYNNKQSLFFIKNGACLQDIGVGSKGDVYHKFPRNETTQNIFTKWKDYSKCKKQ